MRFGWVLAICAAMVLALADFAGAEEQPPLAKIIAVDAADNAVTRRFFGRVVARETVDLAFQVDGQVVKFPVVEGGSVPKDGLIAELDLEPFQLALDQAKARKDQVDRTLARLKQLSGSAASKVSIDDATTEAQLAAIALRNAERAMEQASLHAPFDSLIAVRTVANFTTIEAGTPVVRLHDMSELHIEIDVPEILFQAAGQNQPPELWAEFPLVEDRFPLSVLEYNAETSEVGQTVLITLGMTPPEGRLILPGSSVTVLAQLTPHDIGPVIPHSAIVTANDGQSQVMLFEPAGAEEGNLRLVNVEIAPTEDGRVRVLSGLESGQELVASGVSILADGMTVRRFRGFAN